MLRRRRRRLYRNIIIIIKTYKCGVSTRRKKKTDSRQVHYKKIYYIHRPCRRRERKREREGEEVSEDDSVRDLIEWEREIHTNATHRRIKMCHNVFVVCRTYVFCFRLFLPV